MLLTNNNINVVNFSQKDKRNNKNTSKNKPLISLVKNKENWRKYM